MFTNCMIQVAVVDLATIVGLTSIILYILSSVKFFTFLILLCIWGSRNFHYNEAEQFRQLKPKPQCEKKHNKPNTAKKIIQTGAKLSGTVKAKTARAKEQAGANKRANAERKAQAKADKARAKEQAGANKRANAERKAQAKADKARAKEQQARANERASSEKKARDKAGKSRTSERARPGL
jgi:membrane protein involved in colicin uptake